ncbi:MAG: hypothetical protein QOG53_778 [Frankiales bacterium]|jgi:hypothetical protein|nr:hypothetical protein [Frankiales bacterium]
MGRRALAVLVASAAIAATAGIVTAGPASAHEERAALFPTGQGHWINSPRAYSAARPHIVVCQPDSAQRIANLSDPTIRHRNEQLLKQCAFHSIQLAVDAVKKQKTDIWLLPGLYTEAQYDGAPKGACAQLKSSRDTDFIGTLEDPTGQPAKTSDGSPVALSYGDQLRCPHNLNLVAILGDKTPVADPSTQETPQTIKCDSVLCGVQLAGTGQSPYDVVLDNRFSKLNGIRADRVDGVIISNFTIQRTEFNGLYIMESDGYLIDHMVTRADEEYGILTFAGDHGTIQNNEAYFNGDSGIYPGAASDVNGDNLNFPVTRYAVIVRNNDSHDNNLGYSGTGGNSVWVHHNKFHHNGTGLTTDSFFPNHPGLPQDHSRFGPANEIYGNNQNYFAWNEFSADPPCAKPIEQRGYLEKGVVCPSVLGIVGGGLAIAGGNFNSVDHNKMWDNWRSATVQIWVPAILRHETDPGLAYDTSSNNHYVANRLGENLAGPWRQPNGIDFFWDKEGAGNCWTANTALGGPVTNNPEAGTLPGTCTNQGQGILWKGQLTSPNNPGTSAITDPAFLSCSQYDGQATAPGVYETCAWFHTPAQPAGRQGPAYDFTPYKAPFVDPQHVAPLKPTTTTTKPSVDNTGDNAGNGLATTGGGIGLALLGLTAIGAALWLRRTRRPIA